MADTVTSTQELVITTTMQRGEETATRSFSFPVPVSAIDSVHTLAADLETSLLGGYSTVFQPTSWRDEDIAEDEFTIIEATSELVNKVVTKLDTSGGGGDNYFIGDYNYSDANPTITSATVESTSGLSAQDTPLIGLVRWNQTAEDDWDSVQTAYGDWTLTTETVNGGFIALDTEQNYHPESGVNVYFNTTDGGPVKNPGTVTATLTAADVNTPFTIVCNFTT